MSTDLITTALVWAARTVPVFPVAISRNEAKGGTNKRPLTTRGHLDASVLGADVVALFEDAPGRLRAGEVLGIGAVPGRAGFVVFDCDRHGGPDGVAYAAQHLNLPPYCYWHDTGSGSSHIWMRKRDTTVTITNSSPWADQGVDIRADSGWVVLIAETPWGNWGEAESSCGWDNARAMVPEALWAQLTTGTTGSTSGTSGATSWHRFDPARHLPTLHPAMPALLETLKAEGASVFSYHQQVGREPWLELTCSGSTPSATLGYVSATGLNVFSSGWPGRTTGPQDVHRVDHDDTTSTTDETPLNEGKLSSVPVGQQMGREALLGKFIFAAGIGWHRWDGKRWVHLDTEDPVNRAVVRWVEQWIGAMVHNGTENAIIKPALRYREIGNVIALVKAARTVPGVVVSGSDLDATPWLLNVGNGIVDLRTGTLGPHDPALLMTKMTGADYIPDATHPDWTKTLGALPDDETARWVQKILGAAATGAPDRTGPCTFHWGLGANGKSTLFRAIVLALGPYAVLVPDSLLSGNTNEHPTTLMTLRGARFAYMEELPEEHRLPVARIKKLVDTPEITARLIGQNHVTFTATHTLVISTNYLPKVTETDHGTWRRLVMVPYPHTFTGEGADVTLRARMASPDVLAAVLAWIVEGTRLWLADGQRLDRLPTAVIEATNEWRQTGDLIAAFLDDRVMITGNATDGIPVRELHSMFLAHLPQGSMPWTETLFSTRLKAHHIVTEKTQGVNRGSRNLKPSTLWGVTYPSGIAAGAQGAQGYVGPSHESSFLETTDTTLRTLRTSDETPPTEPVWGWPAGSIGASV